MTVCLVVCVGLSVCKCICLVGHVVARLSVWVSAWPFLLLVYVCLVGRLRARACNCLYRSLACFCVAVCLLVLLVFVRWLRACSVP